MILQKRVPRLDAPPVDVKVNWIVTRHQAVKNQPFVKPNICYALKEALLLRSGCLLIRWSRR